MKPCQWAGWSHELPVSLRLTLSGSLAGRAFRLIPSKSTQPSNSLLLSQSMIESHVRPRYMMLYNIHHLAWDGARHVPVHIALTGLPSAPFIHYLGNMTYCPLAYNVSIANISLVFSSPWWHISPICTPFPWNKGRSKLSYANRSILLKRSTCPTHSPGRTEKRYILLHPVVDRVVVLHVLVL